ncbi:hypothetical protein YWY31_40320 [Paenibacillus illinoisensis]|uniref:S-layer homology domain-containing protein n=1 Tax=Paenibacillus illinoisensis TaxID=59845 RepID=UPI0034BF0F33
MQQKKRPLVWIMLVTMVLSLFPQGLFSGSIASAADDDTNGSNAYTTYFTPDLRTLRETAGLSILPDATKPFLTRSNAYTTSTSSITISGSYAFVSNTSLKVKVEQLNLVTDGTDSKWVADATKAITTAVTADPSGNNKFTANNLNLFPGFNRITFLGNQGSVERSDTFYVLYDQAPFIESFQVFTDSSATGGNKSYNLNEGSNTVVDTQRVSIQGKVQNSTLVSVKVNGGDEINASMLQDGSFFLPQLQLKAGLNNLKFKISSASNAIETERSIYYFDKDQPFTDLKVQLGGQDKSILGTNPTFTGSSQTTATVTGQVLLPYSASDKEFDSTNGEINLANGNLTQPTTFAFTTSDEVLITGSDGVTIEYRLVKFAVTTPYNLELATDGTSPKKEQTLRLRLAYGNFSAGYNASYVFSPGAQDITEIYYLPDYVEGKDIDSQTKLDGTKLQSDSFYIMVESSEAITGTLVGEYLPTGTTKLTIANVASPASLTAKQKIYKITGFLGGDQQVRFYYGSATNLPKVVKISYVTASSIYVESLQNGQTYTFNSKNNKEILPLTGRFIGFKTLNGSNFIAEILVNGKKYNAGTFPKADGTFNIELPVLKEGPIVYGENTILIRATDEDANKLPITISTTLKINVIDKNQSTITSFMPTLIPKDSRQQFINKPITQYEDEEMKRIFSVTPEFAFKEDKYVTSEETYDLVINGGGADIVNVYFGSDKIFTKNLTSTTIYEVNQPAANGLPSYDITGNSDLFIARIQNLKFDAPGTHVYTLELINSTGARTTQRLEIVREPASYRILSPQPTVGSNIVVNKNFVRFDIEAEGATQVLVGKEPAVKRTDMNNRFVLDYVGLKADKDNKIKIEIIRDGGTITDTVSVYYTSAIAIDSQYMAPKVATKYTVFNKDLVLSFPKGTVLQSTTTSGMVKFYPDNKLLFGIADPKDGVVERKNDYGNVIGVNPDDRSTNGASVIRIPTELSSFFASVINTNNFTQVSDIYWINGGLGELGDRGTNGYKAGTNGITPYSIEGEFTRYAQERILTPSQRGTLTLKYDPSIVDDVGSTITVYRYSDNSNVGKWVSIGGVVDTKSHTITVPFDEFGYYKVMKQSQSYPDITNHPWARNLLNAMYSKGIMNPLRTNAFGADDQTTRGEFATLLVKGMDIPLVKTTKATFTDVSENTKSDRWTYEAIETAAKAGIVQGLSDGFFGPDQPVTREQAAVMIARAMNAKLAANDSKLSAALAKSFLDSSSIDFYARPAIQAVTKAKIMEGSPVTIPGATKPQYQFNPKGNMTRAEAAKIAVELLKKSTKLFPKTLS